MGDPYRWQSVLRRRIVAIVRRGDAESAVTTGLRLIDGGLDVVEVSFTTPEAPSAIRALAEARPDAEVGAGTVLTRREAEEALAAGARFFLSPIYSRDVAEVARAAECLYIPGVFTARELWEAQQDGWPVVKVFPAQALGPSGLRALLEPFGPVPTIPTGGIRLDAVADWLQAGAAAVGLGGALTGAVDLEAAIDRVLRAVAGVRPVDERRG
jgi:2-dehydro-3-deoxyphosphogluconate aldolase/(4S)-4-hydroxy-2-oxoglutarate aldolase